LYQTDPTAAEAEDQFYENLDDLAVEESYAYLAEDCDDDEHWDAVNYDYECYVAWKEARKHLDNLRRARGFVPVARTFHRGKGKGKRRGKGKRKGKPGKGKFKSKTFTPSGKGSPFPSKSFGKNRFQHRDSSGPSVSLPPGAPGLPSDTSGPGRPKGGKKGRKVAFATAEDLGLDGSATPQGFAGMSIAGNSADSDFEPF